MKRAVLLSSLLSIFLVLTSGPIFATVVDTCVTVGESTTDQFVTATITLKILLVEFSDVRHRTVPSAYTKTNFENLLSSSGVYVSPNMYSPDGDVLYGSLHDYFQKMTSGNVTINSQVVNNISKGIPIWMALPNTKAQYHAGSYNVFMDEVIAQAADEGLNVGGLGTFVKVVIIYAGNTYFGPSGGYGLNPAANYLGGTVYTMSERRDNPSNQENSSNKFSRIGIHCHEFSHLLGIGHSSGSRADIMAAGTRNGPDNRGAAPAPLNPSHRALKGWLSPILITGQQQYDAYYSLTAPQVFRINSNVNSDYFIIENRRFNQTMTIGTTTVSDYNNSAFFPPAWPHGTITQGIFVWRVRNDDLSDYSTNGLVYASGQYGQTWPEGTPSETDDGVPFPGNRNVRVLSPWSDSRVPAPNIPPGSGIFVPNSKLGSNVGLEVLSENQSQGYFTIMMYQASPQDASPSRPRDFVVSIYSTAYNSHPKLTWAMATEPDVNPNGKFLIWRRILTPESGDPELWLLKDSVAGNITQYIDWSVMYAGSGLYTARYRIKAVDTQAKQSVFSDSGGVNYGNAYRVPGKRGLVPVEFGLNQNYPNPFNPSTHIDFDLAAASNTSLIIYDVLGRKVSQLVSGLLEAGSYTATWNGTTELGFPVSGGVYFVRLVAGDESGKVIFVRTKKAVLLK